jgi:hypothetical protein
MRLRGPGQITVRAGTLVYLWVYPIFIYPSEDRLQQMELFVFQ